jgi:hypothetical protein
VSLDIRIEVLELEGLDEAAAVGFCQGVQRELTRLVAERGLPRMTCGWRSLEVVEAAPRAMDAGHTGSQLGTAVADAIFRLLSS